LAENVTFIDRTFDDAYALMIEARNYIAYAQPLEPAPSEPTLRLQISYETMRVTARLIGAMAWLLTEKAVRCGEISREQSSGDAYGSPPGQSCLDPSGPENEALPRGLRSLLDRSHRLYLRVDRLRTQTGMTG
jgi:regulator of CtrA degradation